MRVAIDTNILAYAEGVDDSVRQGMAKSVLRALPVASVVLPVQVLGELFRVLTRKAKRPAPAARTAVLVWRDSFRSHDTTAAALVSAMDLAADHGFAVWDAVILAVSAEAGCRLLLSEDMHEGFTWRGVTIVNPFAAARHPLLTAALGSSP